MVEDLRDDWHFILAIARAEQREKLLDARDRRQFEEVHGGGSRLATVVREQEARRGIAPVERIFAMMDSDGLRDGHVSRQREEARVQCSEAIGERQVHVLRRRAIENYLPGAALDRWAQDSDAIPVSERQTRVDAWRALRPHARSTYNMKSGLGGDDGLLKERRQDPALEPHVCPHPERPGHWIMAHFAELSAEDRAALSLGFTRAIANDYSQHAPWYCANEDWCEPEAAAELRPFIARLLAAM